MKFFLLFQIFNISQNVVYVCFDSNVIIMIISNIM